MRTGLVATSVAAMMVVASLHAFQSSAHETLLTQARQALGGDRALSAITSFRVKGDVTLPGARGTANGSFEIVCELPDRFVQTEDRGEFWSGETVSLPASGRSDQAHEHSKLGFAGDDLIYEPPARPVGWTISDLSSRPAAPLTSAARLKGLVEARVGFANLTLGMFAASFAGMPLTFSDASGMSAANDVGVTGNGFSATLRFDPVTHLPAALSASGRRTQTYADYRDVHGVKLPFRISNGIETWTVKTFEINPHVDAKVFRPIAKTH